ncbi:hypothetical protein KSS87_007471, partial [Heliosperma pusillum]
ECHWDYGCWEALFSADVFEQKVRQAEVAGSTAWRGRGLLCVCTQRKDSDARPSFHPTPTQEECLQQIQNHINAPYDNSNPEYRKVWQKVSAIKYFFQRPIIEPWWIGLRTPLF